MTRTNETFRSAFKFNQEIILANTLGLPRLAISFILYLHFKLTLKQLKLVTFDPSQDWLQMVVRLFTAKTLEF